MQAENTNNNRTQSFQEEVQKIADKIKSNVEKELNQVFNRFQVVEHNPITNGDPNQTSYSMKVNTGDKDQGHVRLRATQRDPFGDWDTSIDEFFRPRSPFDHMLSTFDPLRTGFGNIQSLADQIKADVEKDLNRTFETFDVMEHHPILTDPEHTSYYMRVKTDDNGHVRVKTIKKEPNSDWQTHVEEYNRGKPAVENGKNTAAIQNKKDDVQIEEEKPATN